MALNLNNERVAQASLEFAKAFVKVIEEASSQKESQAVNTPPANSSDALLTTDQVCKLLSVTSVTIWRWGKQGYLKSIRVGGLNRFRRSDIDRILNSAK